jgi:hypothetical protein
MSTRKFAALSLAAILLSAPFAVTADAATRTQTPATTHHRAAKPVRHVSRTSTRPTTPSADRSADALNAQSLTRVRGQ